MADGVGVDDVARRPSTGAAQPGLSRRAVASCVSASSSPRASSQPRTRVPLAAAPALEREEHVEVPERERLHRKVQDRRAAAQFAEAEDAIQLAHARGRRLALGRETVEQRSPAAAP